MFKILVPTDFSPCATYAMDAALQIAAKLHGEIHLYHRTDVPPPNWDKLNEKEKKCYPKIKNGGQSFGSACIDHEFAVDTRTS